MLQHTITSLGPVMVDIAGAELTEAEIARLSHPLVGGVILFSRNFASVAQISALTAQIHALREPHLLIAVDHEGGRVQRFRSGFTRLPPMRELGLLYDQHPQQARQLAEQTGWVLAAELRACGIDFSFTPVLDLDWSRCAVIGNRAFHHEPHAVYELAHALQVGLQRGGMASVGKHFPGHGWVEGDSHHVIPQDERSLAQLMAADLLPFARMATAHMQAIMPAHVIYPEVDIVPAGYSKIWLQDILRGQLGFNGVIFSDDLCMEGAATAGKHIADRALAALRAGCDMVLVCNRPDLADELLATLEWDTPAISLTRFARMHGRQPASSWVDLRQNKEYVAAVQAISAIGMASGDLDLGVPVGEAPPAS